MITVRRQASEQHHTLNKGYYVMEDKVLRCITYAKRNLVDLVYRSANVEGLGTTFPDTEAIIENLPVNTTRDEVIFILNMRDAYRFLFDNIDYDDNLMFIRELNKIAGNNLIYGSGRLRTQNVTIGGTKWIPTIPNEAVVLEDINMLSSVANAETKAVAYFCYLCRSQLFIDGNKRVAQLMANKILIENGVGIFAIPVERLTEFKRLLVSYYEMNDALDLCIFLKTYCIERI